MIARGVALALAYIFAAVPALAAPAVATDIAPVQSLVARVMQGVGEPALILPPGASPHDYAMRPSGASALASADIVFWIGPALTPWFGRAVESLGADATSVELLKAPGTTLLPYRTGATFDEGRTGETDPHAWLDPENAKHWIGTIARTLEKADPANAAAYARNAADAEAEIHALEQELAVILAPARGKAFVVFHDAYHYFENRFGLRAGGAISPGDASRPSPSRIAAIREAIRSTGATCVFAEPQLSHALLETVIEGTGARAATLDPLGATLTPGPGLYKQLLRNLATTIAGCLTPGG